MSKRSWEEEVEENNSRRKFPKQSQELSETDCRMVLYHVDKILSGQALNQQKRFGNVLLNYDDEVDEIFTNPRKYERPVLECLERYVSRCGNQPIQNIMSSINATFKKCNQAPIEQEKLDKSPYRIESELDKTTGFNMDFSEKKSYMPAFYKLCDLVFDETRLIAHFLLDHNEIQNIFINYQDTKDRLMEVLECWRRKTSAERRTWNCIKAILLFLKKENAVRKVEGKDENTFTNDEKLKENMETKVGANDGFLTSNASTSNEHMSNINFETVTSIEAAYESQVIGHIDPKIITYTANENLYELLVETKISPSNVKIVCSGKMLPTSMKFKDYTARCDKFLKEFLGVEGEEITEHHFLPQKDWWKKDLTDIASEFKEVSRSKNLAFVTGYELLKHYSILRLDVQAVAKQWNVDLKELEDCRSTNRMLIINADLNCVYNMWFSNSSLEKDVLHTLKQADSYLRLLLYLYGHILFGENIYFINCVAAPNCLTENLLIIGKGKSISTWFDDIKEMCSILEKSEEKRKAAGKKLKALLAFLLSSIAIKESIFFKNDIIKWLWLTPEQLKIIESTVHWKIVQGPYGSGKSLVAQSLLKKIVKCAVVPVHVYFIMFDLCSGARMEMKRYSEKISNAYRNEEVERKVFSGNLEDMHELLKKELGNVAISPSVLLSALLQKYKDSNIQFHVLFDEVDKEMFDDGESRKLGQLLMGNREKLSKSHVVFFTRAMERVRNVFDNGRENSSYLRDMELEKNTEMTIYTLTTCMRNPKGVFALTRVVLKAFNGRSKLVLSAAKEGEMSFAHESHESLDHQSEPEAVNAISESQSKSPNQSSSLGDSNSDPQSVAIASLSQLLSKWFHEPCSQDGSNPLLSKNVGQIEENIDSGDPTIDSNVDVVPEQNEASDVLLNFREMLCDFYFPLESIGEPYQPDRESSTGVSNEFIGPLKSESMDQSQLIPASSSTVLQAQVDRQTLKYNDPADLDCYGRVATEDKSKRYIKTTYSFQRAKKIGHGFPGEIPSLILLNYSSNYIESSENLLTERNVHKLFKTFEGFFSAGQKKSTTLVICNRKDELLLLFNVMRMLNLPFHLHFPGWKGVVQLQEEYQIHENDKHEVEKMEVTITNYAGSRGREADQVILCLDPGDHYQRQDMVEGITRCTDRLILLIPYLYSSNVKDRRGHQTVGNIVKKLLAESEKRKDFLDVVKCQDPLELENIQLVRKKISDGIHPESYNRICKPRPVKNLQLTGDADEKVRLTWENDENQSVIIRMKKLGESDWKVIANHVQDTSITLDDGRKECKGTFQVCNLSYVTNIESEPVEITNIPYPVKNLQLTPDADEKIRLTWQNHENQSVIIRKRKLGVKSDWEVIANHFQDRSITLDDEPKGSYCKYQVCSLSYVGNIVSEPVEITNHPDFNPSYVVYKEKRYEFEDLEKLMCDRKWDMLTDILNVNPSIVTMRDGNNQTLVMKANFNYNAPASFNEQMMHHGVDVDDVFEFDLLAYISDV